MSDNSTNAEGLGRRSITAMLWGAGGSVIRIVLQVASQIVLARLLGPELYGVFAVALVFVLLSGLFADVGLAYGLIQKRTVSEADIRFVFSWQVILGAVISTLLWLTAPHIAEAYGDPRVAHVIAMLAPTCLISCLAATSGSLLRRNMDFKTLNIALVVSYAIGYFGFAIPLAYSGAGVSALVAGFLVQSAVTAVIQYAAVRHAVRPLLWQSEAPDILSFGLTVLATNLVNWAMSGIDRAITGSVLGTAAAGLYATAYNLISTPALTLLSLLQSVFYSASAKVQDDRAQLARGLRTLFGTVLLFAAPVFTGIAACADTIILTLYGDSWRGGGVILAPLALAMPTQMVMGLATPVLWASGATRRELELQVPIAFAWVIVLWLVAQMGSLAVLGWSVLALFIVRAAVIVGATLKAIDMPLGDLLASSRAGLWLSGLVAVGALLADRVMAVFLGVGPLLLAADVIVCAIVMLVGLRVLRGRIDEDIRHLLTALAKTLPGNAGHRMLALLWP
ncbi:MAG: lipopolysaccharide biosynthesis protein [Hyphomicrobiaceae bacterium]